MASVSGVVLSWEKICEFSGEDDEIRQVISLVQAAGEEREHARAVALCVALVCFAGRSAGCGHYK